MKIETRRPKVTKAPNAVKGYCFAKTRLKHDKQLFIFNMISMRGILFQMIAIHVSIIGQCT
jgi:hypothetical protein